MSMEQPLNPLLKALPPETDYLSYLTIVEYNLSEDQLPTLHQVLQDTTLTTNIGWDLVHILLPFLPHSKLCLQDVARLGNPREVVLKVTEILETLGQTEEDGEVESDHSGAEEIGDQPKVTNGKQENGKARDTSNEAQFCVLLEMLQMLLPRIKTKFPSRFLSTSLQAVLHAYARMAASLSTTETIITFIKGLSGTRRPKLPPRAGSTAAPSQKSEELQPAPDPEGNDGSVGSEEETLQKRMLQSFLTFVVEAYMTALPLVEDAPGMAWSCRLYEHEKPRSIIPGRRSFTELFDIEQGHLHNRDTTFGQLMAFSRDLSLLPPELLATLITPSSPPSSPVDLPSAASDVPLSLPGSLYLLAACGVSEVLFKAPTNLPSITLLPNFAAILKLLIGASSPASAGMEPLALIDAILALYHCLDRDEGGVPGSVDTFKESMQRLSLLSANTPNAPLRYQAHEITRSFLSQNPDESVRLAYIRDTLENCPYENLKASAVGWLKDQIIAAGSPGTSGKPSLFASPDTLQSLSPFLFIDPASLANGSDFTPFLAHQSFFLAVLNLMYLILSSQTLNVSSWELYNKLEAWLAQLKHVVGDIQTIAKAGQEQGGGTIEGLDMDLRLLQGNMAMVEEALEEIQVADNQQGGAFE